MPDAQIVCLYLAKFNDQLCIATSSGYLAVPKGRELVIDHNRNWNYWSRDCDSWHSYQPLEVEDRNAVTYLPDADLAEEVIIGSELGMLYLKMKESIKNLGGI